jgi:hypothetical protein
MSPMESIQTNLDSPALSGAAYGGQAPISGAFVEVVAMGTTGYGSTGSVLATTTTDASGNFSFSPGAYTCPQSNTPMYIVAIGGDAGSGYNAHIANAAGLGSCTNAKSSFVIVNEITTTALAFSLAQFFTPALGGANPLQADGDWFGGPSSTVSGTTTYSKGLVLGNSYTNPALVNLASGRPNASTSTVTIESAKIITIANILAACVNTNGGTKNSDPCPELFKYTTNNSLTVPADTLQAAVQIALNPSQDTSNGNLIGLIPSSPAFSGGLTTTPNDWTIGISYTSPAFGLGVDSDTTSTLDIDSSGRIWFPSNLSGVTGAGYFDQTSRTFNGPYNGTSMAHPQQVAIDQTGYVWYSDTQTTRVTSYLSTSPATTQSFSLSGSASNSLTIGDDNRVNVGVTIFGTTYEIANIAANRSSYTAQAGTSLSYPTTSMAADVNGGNGVASTNYITVALKDYYVVGSTVVADITSNRDGNGQVVYTGNDFIATRPFSSQSSNGKSDGLCIFSENKCFKIKGSTQNVPLGLAIDGAKNLWLPESGDSGLLQVTPTGNSGDPKGGIYLNSGGGIPNNEFLHGTGNGGTLGSPFGVAVDNEGNVWMSNATCSFTGCTSSAGFTLTEIVGVAAPTITPVSAQIAGGINLAGTEPTN